MSEPDYSNWHLIPQAKSSYDIHITCQIENYGWLLEQLPVPFGTFDPTRRGSFVEVGSFDGPTYSNVWQFAKAGWDGVMIEPMPENLVKLKANISTIPNHKIILEPVACSDAPGLIPMFSEREGSRAMDGGGHSHQIQAMRLDDILDKNRWQPDFDMLVIDVETHEQPVLRGFDVAKWRPKAAIVEAYDWQRDWIINRFEGYRLYYADGLNVILVRKDWAP